MNFITKTFWTTERVLMAMAIFVAVLSVASFGQTVNMAQAGGGSIWTTLDDCGDLSQDKNHYDIGDTVHINGAGFDEGPYDWEVRGGKGGSSADPDIVVANGTLIVDSTGTFCFDAYVVAADDNGEYKVDFGGKNDNYRVNGITPIYGCTDPGADNYDELATDDDGSCEYHGCMDQTAVNYNPSANVDDDSCEYEGCTDPSANNYDPIATIDDGSCEYPVPGCMDDTALNYDDTATEDDGSCHYPQVTLCKMDVSGAPLSGWDLFLDVEGDGVGEYTGTTLGDGAYPGCVLIGDVPVGNYILDEDFTGHDGWVNVSDAYYAGVTVMINSASHTLTLVNDLPDTEGIIIVEKEVTLGHSTTTDFTFVSNWTTDFLLADGGIHNSGLLVAAAGPYSVSETVPAGWEDPVIECESSIQDIETADTIELDAGETVTCTFTNSMILGCTDDSALNFNSEALHDNPAAEQCTYENEYRIDGYKWIDTNENADREVGEEDRAGWTIFLDENGDGIFDVGEVSTTTDGDGYYWFIVTAGEYEVAEVQQGGFTQTGVERYGTPMPGTNTCEFTFGLQTASFTGHVSSITQVVFQNSCNFGNIEIPAVCDYGFGPDNLLANGSFEEPVVTAHSGTWEIFSTVANWVISLSDGLELWNGLGIGASDGEQNAELDGNDATMITQTVVTEPGATYELRFDFAARVMTGVRDTEANNHIEAAVDGVSLVNQSTDNTDWIEYSATFEADGSSDISFADLGTPQDGGGSGTLLDNAVLCKVSDPVIPDPLTCNLTGPSTVSRGANFDLSWTTSGAEGAVIDQGINGVPVPNGTHGTSITSNTTFTMTAYEFAEEGDYWGEQTTCSATVTIRSGGGGGSVNPSCRAFGKTIDGSVVTLNWETRNGRDMTITANGEVIVDTSDDDYIDEGSYEYTPTEATEYELIVIRGDKEDECTASTSWHQPEGQVFGEQTSKVPTVAGVSTGAGGTSPSPYEAMPLMALLAMVASFAVLRKTNVNEL